MTSPKLTVRLFPPIHWALASDHLTIFAGQEAESRARDYRDALKEGRLGTRIVDAKVARSELGDKVIRFPR